MHDLLGQGQDRAVPDRVTQDEGEQRVAPRVGLLIRSAKVVTSSGEFLCVIRDVSETGISARTFHPLPASDIVTFELQNGDRYDAEMVWQEEGKAGFRFLEQADLQRLVDSPSPFAKRQIRINLEVPAELDIAGRLMPTRMLDLSQQGAKVECPDRLPIHGRVTLRADGLPEIRAKIRWWRDGLCGLVFEDTMQFAELAHIVLDLQVGHGGGTCQKAAG